MEPDYKKLYEEEHKKYEETLSRAKGLIDGMKEENVNATKEDIKNLFPGEEFEENENERIRRNCIHFLELQKKHHAATFEIEECITWLTSLKDLAFLKKQDEQKSTDIPKFKVDDWVINSDGKIRHIIGVDEFGYQTDYGWLTHDIYEREFHLWTIQDAKDGDVLVASDGSIFLFKGVIDCGCKHYVALTIDNVVRFNEGLEHSWETSTSVHPATKEQRDLLFTKMKEAGYNWDAEKKELWHISYLVSNGKRTDEHCDTTDWLKSLKDRMTWKPTEEQMEALENAAREAEYNQRFKEADALRSLDKDLKKL